MSDKTILQHITDLTDEEHRLRNEKGPDAATLEEKEKRIKSIATELDQCWDLLRQRRARQEFGEDPANAKLRDVKTVEGYEG